jgi:hypothetical protein
MIPNRAKFAIVIKTDSYAGNFEREMCAHLTGHVGECEVGGEYVDETLAQEFENIIGNEADDNGCYRPVTLGSDIEGFTNQDVVIFFDKEPTQKHLFLIKERLPDFDYSGEKVLGVELIEFHFTIIRKEI